ncbi:polar amino acid ABC transporter permease [Haladaptatus sp. R4]|uniref:amino acid ABC transporter permease n=1 Tax=unclassified Haladaptatus TaxID=2622732 RepID=UPI0007B45DD1|nr:MULTISPECIES: amino acid ABC transporter permease [unclassified Haladaptatus]KZN26329.1 polar amino acid ABC transporter permease [Haladaptatus sp. R4]MCO8256238.1 amino acid ABC transporter permease [Haladaptatus sp. AB618]
MAETYHEDAAAEDRSGDGLLTDTRLKWFGIVFAGGFTLLVAYFLFRILTEFVDYDLLVAVFPRFVDAYILVLEIVIISSVLSLIGGLFVGLGRVSKTKFTHAVATGYVEFFRGTPLLFQLLVIFTGLPAFGIGRFSEWRWYAAVIGLTLNHAAYSGEAIKGGITAIPDGQMEAARSLGMSYISSMRKVVLPQALRNALAAVGNDQIILVKDTSLLTVLAIPELISVFRNVNSNQFDAWTPIVLVAVAYLAVTLPLGKLVRMLESRAAWGEEQ